MTLNHHAIAVCSWSLHPKNIQDLAAKVRQLGLEHVQLALADLVMLDDKQKHQELGQLRAAGLKLTGCMISFPGEDYATIARIRETGGYVPDDLWPLRKRLSIEGAKLARDLGATTITTHVGFVPAPTHARYRTILDRIREVADAFNPLGLQLLMETGQEPADELLHFLNDLSAPNVHINFDPANMILYGAGDPIEAIRILGPHIRHVHVKDATGSQNPGVEWGAEVPFGAGTVGPQRFLAALNEVGYTGPLAIEREAGNDRMGDVKRAIDTLQQSLTRE